MIYPVGCPAGEFIPVGSAVGVWDGGLYLCSAFSDKFLGFAYSNISMGSIGSVISGRGSIVTPVVEGGGALTVDAPVWLSVVPGAVVQSPVEASGAYVVPLGYAISVRQMVLRTEMPFRNS